MNSSKQTVLIVGATGATGKHVVQMLLDKGHTVRAIVRSSQRMRSLLSIDDNDEEKRNRLQVTEASLLDMEQPQLQQIVNGCDAVVSCLGHNMTFKGIWGKPRKLVTDSVQRLYESIQNDNGGKKKTKMILMGSNGVANPNGKDNVRPLSERIILSMLRCLVPPHADNEMAAAYLHDNHSISSGGGKDMIVEWCVVRPDDLVNADVVSAYELKEKPEGSLFGAGTASRVNVADFMTNLIVEDKLWSKWVYGMPVLNNKE